MDSSGPKASDVSAAEVGVDFWRNADLVDTYDRSRLRPVEAFLIDRYRTTLAGRVLELGVGAGRVTRALYAIASELYGIDVSEAMVRRAAAICPGATIEVRDIREIGVYGHESFDAVVGSFNVIDVFDHADRERVLDAVRTVLRPGGLFLFSSHNRGAISRVHGPVGQLLDDVEHLRLKRSVAGVIRLPRRLANRARMRSLERDQPDYAIVNDTAHDYALAQYYIERDEQERQLARHGLQLEACYDLRGSLVQRGSSAPNALELSYVAARDDDARVEPA